MDGDMENGGRSRGGDEEIKQPLIHHEQEKGSLPARDEEGASGGQGSIWVVVLGTFVAVCGSFDFGSCVGYSAPTQEAIRKDLDLSLAEYSVFGSVVTIGAMIGAITSGRIADYIRRKGAMRMSAIFCLVGWLAVYFSLGAWSLDVGRFSMGYGIGVLSYVVPVFIAEITPKNLRGGLTAINQLMMICTGISVSFITGTFISWRMLTLTGLIPCVILLVGLCFIPESPRWLAKVGRQKDFETALRALRGQSADIAHEAAEIKDYIEILESLPKARIKDMCDRRYARSVVVGVGLMMFQQFGGINGIIFYARFSSGKLGTIAMGVIQIPLTALGAILMDRSGRRPLLMLSATGTCLGCILTGVSLSLKAHEILLGLVPILALSGILLYLGSFSLGLGAVPWVVMSEIFPINVKGSAGSLVTLVNWFGSWAVSFTFNFLMSWSSPGTFFVYAAVSGITVVFVAKMVPETKGRTLEEIQTDINS